MKNAVQTILLKIEIYKSEINYNEKKTSENELDFTLHVILRLIPAYFSIALLQIYNINIYMD